MSLFRLAAALIIGATTHLFVPTAVLTGLVFGVAIVYEKLRAKSAHSSLSFRPTARAVAIWVVVGIGYAIRAAAGIWLAGFHVISMVTVSGMLYFAVFGIMSVLILWVLEAASYCQADGKKILYPTPGLTAKPHIASLLRWTRWEVHSGIGSSAGATPGAAERILTGKRIKPGAPWNISLVFGAGLGAVFGATLIRSSSMPSAYLVVVAVSVSGAIGLIMFTGLIIRLVVIMAVAVALIGLTLPAARGSLVLVTAIPWVAIATNYAVLCESSYQEFMSFGPRVVSMLTATSSLPWLLLRLVVGLESWRSAGFDRIRK